MGLWPAEGQGSSEQILKTLFAGVQWKPSSSRTQTPLKRMRGRLKASFYYPSQGKWRLLINPAEGKGISWSSWFSWKSWISRFTKSWRILKCLIFDVMKWFREIPEPPYIIHLMRHSKWAEPTLESIPLIRPAPSPQGAAHTPLGSLGRRRIRICACFLILLQVCYKLVRLLQVCYN